MPNISTAYAISSLSPKTYTCFAQSRGNYYFPVAFNVANGHTRFRSRGTVPPIVSRSAWYLFSFPLPLSRLFTLAQSSTTSLSSLHPLFPLFRLLRFLFLSLFLLLVAIRSLFLCLSPGRRKEALQEIHLQRRGTVQQNTNDIFTWRRERNRRDGFTRERFIERYAKGRGRNVKCIF